MSSKEAAPRKGDYDGAYGVNQPSWQKIKSHRGQRQGVDPVLESMIRQGEPLIRENYIARTGFKEPLAGKHLASVDEVMKMIDVLNDPDPNRPEIEADRIRAGKLRLERLKRGPPGGLM
ncbi:hypothetical protein ACLIJR_04210 [Hydrogenophaga sp. XSHU_21]